MENKLKEIKNLLETRSLELYRSDIEGLSHSLQCIDIEFKNTNTVELVDKYINLLNEDIKYLVGHIVGVKKSKFTPDWLHYKDGTVVRVDSKCCIYVKIDGEIFKLNIEDLILRHEKKIGNRIHKTYSYIEVRTFDTSKTLHRVVAKNIALPSELTRSDAIIFANAKLLMDMIELKDKTYRLF